MMDIHGNSIECFRNICQVKVSAFMLQEQAEKDDGRTVSAGKQRLDLTSSFLYHNNAMEILRLGNDTLRQKSEPVEKVTDEIRQLAEEMFKTMEAGKGVGLAAPQVGILQRLFVITADDGVRRVFINPQIIATSQETCEFEEGCLSIPNVWEYISRPAKVTVQALNEKGKPFTLEADGYLARIIQHENDHLDGILYIDRGDAEFRQKTIDSFEKRELRRQEKQALKAAKAAKIAAKKAKKQEKPC